MNGVSYKFDEKQVNLLMIVDPGEFEKEISSTAVYDELKDSQYSELYLSRSTIKSACEKANHLFKSKDFTPFTEQIGERRNAEVEFKISEDEMEAKLTIAAPYGGKLPSVDAVVQMAQRNGIKRGLGKRKITKLLKSLELAEPGEAMNCIVAKGLPPKDGHSSYMKPLVPNALERVLRPKEDDSGKSDLRNLGDIICVKAHDPVVRRMPPSNGRKGYTVTGKQLSAKPGEWLLLKRGDGTEISKHDENLVLASHSGMPKFSKLVMSVDNTFSTNGVNVGTGHVIYEGAVMVNGDVTEKMRIEASGDITINGFVESAYIEAGGDIIITEGALGKEADKKDKCSCVLKAGGSIHIQHGQGLSITCGKDVSIGKQLAYSYIDCGGKVIVGNIDKPKGNIFACEITSKDCIVAGTLGAVSGSSLFIDFSDGFNKLNERIDIIDDLVKQLRDNTKRHKEKIKIINTKSLPKSMIERVKEVKDKFDNEAALLEWIEEKAQELRSDREKYQARIKIIANEKLYSGVSLKLNKRTWRSVREYDRSEVFYDEHQWKYEPLVR